jgi:hypothetical protein
LLFCFPGIETSMPGYCCCLWKESSDTSLDC